MWIKFTKWDLTDTSESNMIYISINNQLDTSDVVYNFNDNHFLKIEITYSKDSKL
jgi:hypothetical protein